ncbi:hypothetical protein SEA_EVANESCE_62 [Mycobacterium phage Evanesce]|uniref:Uncharacterized protein n=14 Tax=Caudoviricetes TaxID=2731619 RepID=A0A385D076_9CAUD|nr:hypothetical protein Giles_60 [Mycobacterium phage Giles]AHY84247.1 hypothetical protein PBI_HH92_62 [Mycobacterium phage HH92]AKQ07838.1 hypothetical protein SEA_KINBOTE_62 [Mycobacterium phage Kinbote]ALF00283.1 hypothetical protein SEA_EVANESCE_62 [Mycobacterium phage Evanesce]ATN90436.1 hypothetical protein SEA_LILHAZELNUT_63 [Mycobacterium phage LilHazelnut]AXQ51493.1 hypothetical protein SEA_AMOCHICK_63 [Mycobacterium phage Amochick]QBQ71262.1 hypothetical protein SEA_DAEGAL_65 [Myco
MPNVLHYRGDVVDAVLEMSNAHHLFGPDSCGPAAPGKAVGHGAFWEPTAAEFDPEFVWPDGDTRGRTTVTFKPYVDPRARLRYFGGDPTVEVDEPADIGAPTLHTRDNIRGR